MSHAQPYLPTQAAEFSGPGKQAIVLYCPDWTAPILALLASRPTAYEAAWRFAPEQRAHLLEVDYEGAEPIAIALVDGVHNAVIASLARGRALVLSPHPLYREYEGQAVDQLFDPEQSLLLPELPSPLDLL
ncbi:MAG: hypothetical protein ACOY94_08590 [Bacillota bacterium]